MFDLSFAELLVIGVVALVVLGPERLPKAARFAGVWVRRARGQWQSVKSELERELAAEELKRDLDHARSAVRDAEDRMRATDTQARREANDLRDDLQATARAATGRATPTSASVATNASGDASDAVAAASSPGSAAVTPTDAHPLDHAPSEPGTSPSPTPPSPPGTTAPEPASAPQAETDEPRR